MKWMCRCRTFYFKWTKVQYTGQLHSLTFELLNIEADSRDNVGVLLLLRLEVVEKRWFSWHTFEVISKMNKEQTWIIEPNHQHICLLFPQTQRRDQLVKEPHEENNDVQMFEFDWFLKRRSYYLDDVILWVPITISLQHRIMIIVGNSCRLPRYTCWAFKDFMINICFLAIN